MDPTEFEMVSPPPALSPFVRRYLHARKPFEAPITVHPKPTGYTYLSCFLGSSTQDRVVVDGRSQPRTSRWHLAGQIVDHRIEAHFERGHEILFCELAATAHHRLFGIPGEAFVGAAPALGSMRPDCESLARECFAAGPDAAWSEHVGEANVFFSRLAEKALPGDPAVERAVAMFEAANGAIRIATICAEVGLSPRQLNRRFTHIVGVGPKFFGQILQINWVVALLYFNDTATLTEIAHEAGFYDQAHFNRAMRLFFSEGPREFLRSNHLLFKTFLGASRRFGPTSPPRRAE